MQTNKRAITPPSVSRFLIFCFFVSSRVFVCLRLFLAASPFSLHLRHSVDLSLFLPRSSFLVLFISRGDGPQRRSAELSDLNKCLRLELRLSCGLGRRRGSRCWSHSVVPRRLNETLSKPPPPPLLFVTLSLRHLFLMAWETCGKPQPLSPSEQTRQLRMVTVFLSQWLLL